MEHGIFTVIASESCFARGVDHCRASDDDHLIAEEGARYLQREALRKQLRAWKDITDLIAAFI
jgi:hypothetical protein